MTIKIKWHLLVFLICFLSISCSKKILPIAGYEKIKMNTRAVEVNKITFTNAENINPNNDYKFNLNLNDSILVYKDTIYSNYKTFSIKTSKEKNYSISIYSICDCWGFKKYMFNPEVLVSNSLGEKLDLKLNLVKFGYDKGPLSLNKKYTLTSSTDRIIYLTVFSNNETLQKDLYKFIVAGAAFSKSVFVPIVVPVGVKSSLIGDFFIRIDEQ